MRKLPALVRIVSTVVAATTFCLLGAAPASAAETVTTAVAQGTTTSTILADGVDAGRVSGRSSTCALESSSKVSTNCTMTFFLDFEDCAAGSGSGWSYWNTPTGTIGVIILADFGAEGFVAHGILLDENLARLGDVSIKGVADCRGVTAGRGNFVARMQYLNVPR